MGKAAARNLGILKGGLLRIRRDPKRRRRAFRSAGLLFFVFTCVTFLAGNVSSQDLAVLSERLQSGDTEQRRDALFQIRNLRTEEASRLAITSLRDKNPMVRATAASSVIFAPRAEAAAALLPLLNDKDEFVRREAAFALGEVGDPSAAGQLIKTMNGDKSLEVRTAAAVALGKVGNLDAVAPLRAILDQRPTEDNEMLRRAAARSIGQTAQIARSGKVKVMTPQNFMPEKHKDIGTKPTPDLLSHFSAAVRSLVRVLESSSEADDTRREAAYALGAIGDRSSEAVLLKYTASRDIYLAEICHEALIKLRSVE